MRRITNEKSAHSSIARQRSSRAGIATIWVILTLPALVTVLVVMVDLANIWQAHTELKNAMDAAAISAVKTWGEAGGGSTAQARLDANDASNANTVLDVPVTLNTATGGCTNGNVSSTGEIILGSVTDSGGMIVFDCSGSPSCISGTAEIDIEVNTTGGDTYENNTDPEGGNIARRSFRVLRFEETTGVPVGLTLNSVQIDLTPMTIQAAGGGPDVADDGFFDLRGGPSDVNGGIGTPPGPPPVPDLIGVDDQGVGATFSFSGGTATEPRILLVTFGGGGIVSEHLMPSRFFFGVDTDSVGGEVGGGGGLTSQDFGGDFGTETFPPATNDPYTSTGARITVNVSGQTFSGTLDRFDDNRSTLSFTLNIVSGGTAFGVRTRKTVQVSSLCSTLFGASIGNYDVTAESFARFTCTAGPPQLIRVDSVTCVCP